MDMKKTLYFLFSAAGMLVLILDGQTALAGAAEGLELCIKAVIPSLFPFLFLSSILIGALWGTNSRFLSRAGMLLGIPKGAESILIAGFLGGYPSGAGAVGQAYREGGMDKASAEHLLTFCSNAGPAFLFGITAAQFSHQKMLWVLWAIHILSAVTVGLFNNQQSTSAACLSSLSVSPAKALNTAVRTTGILCGWILCFRILLKFLDRWFLWMLPEAVRILIWGFLELSNGCCSLAFVQSEALRFLICSVMLAFGGICVAMQTASVTEGISLRPYLFGKTAQTLVALVMSLLYLRFGIAGVLVPPILPILLGPVKKGVAFRRIPVYNAGIMNRRS